MGVGWALRSLGLRTPDALCNAKEKDSILSSWDGDGLGGILVEVVDGVGVVVGVLVVALLVVAAVVLMAGEVVSILLLYNDHREWHDDWMRSPGEDGGYNLGEKEGGFGDE